MQEQVTPPSTENDDQCIIGDIKISIPVVASIVKYSALEIGGVFSVGGSDRDGLLEHLGGKKAEKGVSVVQTEQGKYQIEVHLVMRFGTVIYDATRMVQRNIVEKISQMTGNEVDRVDVLVDGIRNEKEDPTSGVDAWERSAIS